MENCNDQRNYQNICRRHRVYTRLLHELQKLMHLVQRGERNQLSLDIRRRMEAREQFVSVCNTDWNRFVETRRKREKESEAANRHRESRDCSCANKNSFNCDLIDVFVNFFTEENKFRNKFFVAKIKILEDMLS